MFNIFLTPPPKKLLDLFNSLQTSWPQIFSDSFTMLALVDFADLLSM